MKGRVRADSKYPSNITEDGVAVVVPSGRLDLPVASALRTQLLDLVTAGHTRIVVDLSGVDLIDSSGLGALVFGFEAARESGGDLKIMSPGEQPTLVLELTNVNRVLLTVDSLDGAFGKGGVESPG